MINYSKEAEGLSAFLFKGDKQHTGFYKNNVLPFEKNNKKTASSS